jgi:hypothetical protein
VHAARTKTKVAWLFSPAMIARRIDDVRPGATWVINNAFAKI